MSASFLVRLGDIPACWRHSRLTPPWMLGARIGLAGPYDLRLSDAASSVRCFTVRSARHPMKMHYAVVHADPDAGLSERLVGSDLGMAPLMDGPAMLIC